MDLPVSEINDLVRKFSTSNKAATFQEEGLNGDVHALHDNQEHTKMTGIHKEMKNRHEQRRRGRRSNSDSDDEDDEDYFDEDELKDDDVDYGLEMNDHDLDMNDDDHRRLRQISEDHRRGRTTSRRNRSKKKLRQRKKSMAQQNSGGNGGWSGPPPGTIIVTQQQIISLKQNVNQAHQRRTKVLKKQLMANKKFIEQLSKKLSSTTEKLIELQVRGHAGGAVGNDELNGVAGLIGGLSDGGANGANGTFEKLKIMNNVVIIVSLYILVL